MTQLVSFPDPVRAIIDYLNPLLAARSDDYLAGYRLGAWYPTDSSPTAPAIPYLQINSDGVPTMSYPITLRPTVRATVWHRNPTPAHQFAVLVLGLLAVHPGDEHVWAVRPLTGPLPGVDSRTGHQLNSLTVQVSVRPTAV